MEKTTITVLTLFLLLPVVLGANIYRELQKGTDFCQEKDTVCKMSSGLSGCCPAKDAVCCADGDHCCPTGYKCDLSAKQCLRYEDQSMIAEDVLYVAPLETEASHKVIKGPEPTVPGVRCEIKAKPFSGDISNSVSCPGGGACPVNTTCCMDISGIYEACCPTPFGNCCSDYFSCCPSGYVCNNINRPKNCIKAGG